MPTTTLQPTANQTPDAGQALTSAVTGAVLTGHGATVSSVTIGSEESGAQTKTCRWFDFQAITVVSARLQFSWSLTGELTLTGAAPGSTVAAVAFDVEYSLDNGANWSSALSRSFSRDTSGTTNPSDSGSVDLNIAALASGLVQVRNRIKASASSTLDPTVSASASITATISGIQLEVTTADNAPPPVMII